MTYQSSLTLPTALKHKVDFARNQNLATPSIARYAMDCLDLTSLKGDETEQDIKTLCAKAMTHGVHSVCIYPDKVDQVSRILAGSKIVTATVINFPTGLAMPVACLFDTDSVSACFTLCAEDCTIRIMPPKLNFPTNFSKV